MKPSYYNLNIPYKNNLIIYNCLTGSLIFKKGRRIDNLFSKDVFLLKNQGIMIEDRVDEKTIFKVLFESYKYNNTELEFVVIPTYSCNLNCKYCYEGEKLSKSMDKPTAKSIIKFIKKTVLAKNSQSFSLRFYGGEPMVNGEIVFYFLEKMNQFIKQNRIRYSVSIVSNGTLFNHKIIKKLKRYPITLAITLNGPKSIHDRNRPFLSGKGTYDQIIKNLLEIKKQNISAYVCINIDKRAYSHVEELLDSLVAVKLNELPLNFGIILPIRNACNYPYPASIKLLPKLWQMAVNKGFKMALGMGLPHSFSYCKQLTANGYTIDPEGKLYSCIALPLDNFLDGEIDSRGNATMSYNYYKWLARDPLKIDKCRVCKILPLCCGGCPLVLKNIKLDKPACYLKENIIKTRIKLYLKQNFPERFTQLRVA